MANMAKINGNVVVEVLKPIDGFDITDCFHPDVLSGCVAVGDDVQQGWVLTEAGFVDPATIAPEVEAPVEEAPADTPPAA